MKRIAARAGSRPSDQWPWLLPFLACVYLPFIGGGFLTDDFAHIRHLSALDSPVRLIDRPDTFGFYRPVTQASMALDLAMHGWRPARLRAVNVGLHAGIIALALVVSRLILRSSSAAVIATLVFALTPKSPPIAVLWISARAELLMTAFTLAAVIAWIRWMRNGRPMWLIAAAVSYLLAMLSKETATLLPVLLLVTPGARRPWKARAAGVAALCGLAVAMYMWRAHVGALVPFTHDAHYDLLTPFGRWGRNARNYAGRIVVAPFALVVLVALTRAIVKRRSRADSLSRTRAAPGERRADAVGTTVSDAATLAMFSFVWVIVFLAPVLPIVARSELYLYLPVFGVCLIAGLAVDALGRDVAHPRAVTAATVIFVGLSGVYQAARALEIHRDLAFSEKLVAALRNDADLVGRTGAVLIVPSDALTERFLRDSIGGYLTVVLNDALDSTELTGEVQYSDEPPRATGLRLISEYRNGQVKLTKG